MNRETLKKEFRHSSSSSKAFVYLISRGLSVPPGSRQVWRVKEAVTAWFPRWQSVSPLFQHTACLEAPSHATSFRLWPPRGMAGTEPPDWSPESHTEGPLGLPRTKSCQLAGTKLSSSHLFLREEVLLGNFLLPAVLKRAKVPSYMETVTGCLRCSVYLLHVS